MLILEVGLVENLAWGIHIEVIIEGNGKVGVTEASSHIMKILRGEEVSMKAICMDGDIY